MNTWPGPPRPQKDGTIAVTEFNQYVERADAAWTRSPLLLTIEFLRIESPEAATTAIDLETSPEGANEASVTVTLDGLLDDSVRSVRTFLTVLRQPDETWRLKSARREQRCWPDHGHQNFSPAPCL